MIKNVAEPSRSLIVLITPVMNEAGSELIALGKIVRTRNHYKRESEKVIDHHGTKNERLFQCASMILSSTCTVE